MSCKIESVDIIQGNSFTLNIYVTHYNIDTQVMEPYILDDATDAFVRLVGNNGVVRKFTNITINENIATCFIDGTKLKTGTYGIEFSFKKDGYDKRSYKCCLLKVHNCDCQVDEQPLSEYDIAVAFGADNQVINVGGLVWAHVDDHLDKNSQNPVTNSAITNTLTNDYASKQWVIDVMTDGQIDLSSYVSDAELADTLASYVTNSQLQEAIDNIPQPDLTDYYTKREIDDKFDNIPSAEVDLSSYVTRQELAENNFAYASQVADLTEELIADEQVIATHAHKIHDLESYFPSYATVEYVNSVVAGGDIDLSSYVTKQELSDAHYAYKGDVIEDELVLAYAVHDIQTLNSYFVSYVKLSEYNELVNSYNKLYLTLTYLMDNVSWSGASASPEEYTFGYIIGHARKGFSTIQCEAFPETYFSAPMFKVWVADGTLSGSCEYMFMDTDGGWNDRLSDIISFNVDTSGATSMHGMFMLCTYMTAVDLSHFNTLNATDMSSMFNSCWSLRKLDLSNFDTSNVTNMNHMFSDCRVLANVNVSSFDTSNVISMAVMFSNCLFIKDIDLSNFNFSRVGGLEAMFLGCKALKTVDLKQFGTLDTDRFSEVYADRMFKGCDSLHTVYVDDESEFLRLSLINSISGSTWEYQTVNGRHALVRTV